MTEGRKIVHESPDRRTYSSALPLVSKYPVGPPGRAPRALMWTNRGISHRLAASTALRVASTWSRSNATPGSGNSRRHPAPAHVGAHEAGPPGDQDFPVIHGGSQNHVPMMPETCPSFHSPC